MDLINESVVLGIDPGFAFHEPLQQGSPARSVNSGEPRHDPAPRLEYGRYGWEMRGKMRLHNRKGYSYVNTACDVRGNRVEMEFLR